METERKFSQRFPQFYEIVREFPDFRLEAGLAPEELEEIERKIDYRLHDGLKEFFSIASSLKMNGLSIKARELGPIVTPATEAVIIGEFYLHQPGDRLLMLPDDASIYYLEQRNGAITKMAKDMDEFLNHVLPRFL